MSDVYLCLKNLVICKHGLIKLIRYDLELHMVHKSDDGKIAVIGALYALGKPDYFLSKVSKHIATD